MLRLVPVVCVVLLMGSAAAAQKMDAATLAEGQKGVEFYEAGRFEEALAVFKKMEKKIPTDNQVCLARV